MSFRSRGALAFATAFTVGAGLEACVEPNPNHCFNNDGDAFCARAHPDWPAAFCSDGTCVDPVPTDGCVQTRPVGCHYCEGSAGECSMDSGGETLGDTGDGDSVGDGDGTTTGDGDGTTTGDGDGDGDGTSAGDGDGTTTGDGDGDGECSAIDTVDPVGCDQGSDTPFCSGGACVDCTGVPAGQCLVYDNATPACDDATGRCELCTAADSSACAASTPACDETTHTCVECTAADTAACTGATPVCDDANQICVQCTAADPSACTGATPVCDEPTTTCVQCNAADSTACTGATPVCDEPATTCVQCTAADASACTGSTPVCDDPSRTCVECTAADTAACTGTTPVCDTAGMVCEACDEHSDCPTSACNHFTGACFDDTRVWWVDKDVAVSGDGSMAMPYATIAEAIANIASGEDGVLMLVEAATQYLENLTVTPGQTVAVLGQGTPVIEGVGLNAIDVGVGGVLVVEGVQISNAGQTGLASNGDTRLDRVTISGNPDGVLVAGGTTTIVNSWIVLNGNSFSPDQAVFNNGGALTIAYTTIAANEGSDPGNSVACFGGGSTSVTDSIILAGAGSSAVLCASLVLENSAVDDSAIAGGTNVDVGALIPTWFVNAGAGDYHLAAGHPFADIAQWQPGDPSTDFDGDARPTASPGHPGADEP